MTPEEFKKLTTECQLRQKDVAWICGVCSRQVRSWGLGRYPVPRGAELLLLAYAEGMVTSRWLRARIPVHPPV